MQVRRYRDADMVRLAQMTGHAMALYLDAWSNRQGSLEADVVRAVIGA